MPNEVVFSRIDLSGPAVMTANWFGGTCENTAADKDEAARNLDDWRKQNVWTIGSRGVVKAVAVLHSGKAPLHAKCMDPVSIFSQRGLACQKGGMLALSFHRINLLQNLTSSKALTCTSEP